MSLKVSFAERTVSINTTLSFDQMAIIEDLLATASMEAVEGSNAGKTVDLSALAETFGIDIDIDIEIDSNSSAEATLDLGNLTTGQDSAETA